MGGAITEQHDKWIVRDETGMLHRAAVHRFFWADGSLRAFHVSTACRPHITRVTNKDKQDWSGARLPLMVHETVTIVEWRVREEPTCLACIVHPNEVFG